MRPGVVLLALLIATSAAAQDAESGAEVRTVARLVITSGVTGHLGAPVCADGVSFETTGFGYLTPRLVAEAAAPDRPLIFDTGGLLTPGGAARFAVEHAPDELADLVDALGYRALAFGPELAAPRAPMIRALAALREHRIPAVATNLRCRRSARALCDVLVDVHDGPSLHRVGDRTAAFLAFLPEGVLQTVAPDRARGIVIDPPEESMPVAVRRARARGADLVVASVGALGDDPVARAFEVVGSLPEDARPDVLVIADGGEQITFARPPSFTPAVVAAPPGGAARVRVRESRMISTFDVFARSLAPSSGVARVHRAWMEDTGTRYCREWGRTLAGGETGERPTGDELLALSAGVLRSIADADVAVINRGVLDAAWTAARNDALTASDVYVALQFDEPVVVSEVSADWLSTVASRAESHDLLVLGVDEDGAVNERPLEPRGEYRVATIRFLAAGGDGALPEGPAWRPLGEETLRSAVLGFLDTPREEDPRVAVDDPADRLEWTLSFESDASFGGTTVDNPADYDAARLDERRRTLTLGFLTRFRADGVSRAWGWENEAVADYRTTATGTSDLVESDDLLSVRTTVLYRGLRSRHDRFYVPNPYVEGYVESEITRRPRPDELDAAGMRLPRPPRHLLVRPTAGLRFSFTDHLSLALGGGVQRQLLDDAAQTEPGANALLVLRPWKILSDDGRSAIAELTIDYFLGGDSQELRSTLETTLDLVGPLALLLRVDLFAQKDRGQPLGVSLDGTAGLRLRWLARTLH